MPQNPSRRTIQAEKNTSRNEKPGKYPILKPAYYSLLMLTGICIALFIFFLVYNAAWILGDDNQLLSTIFSGKIWPINHAWLYGRFYPLYYVEFIPFIVIGNIPSLVFSWVAVKMIATIALLYLVLRESAEQTPFKIRNPIHKPSVGNMIIFIFILLFLFGTDIFKVYGITIYPEQTLIPALILFIYAYFKIEKTGSPVWIFICILSANIACYLKEPVFVIFLIIGMAGIIAYRGRSKKQIITDLLLIFSTILFVGLYYFLVRRNATSLYNEGRALGSGYWDIIKSIVAAHPLILLLTVVAIVRSGMILVRRQWNVMDAILIAPLAYSAAFVVLKLYAAYYFTPVYILSIPALFYILTTWFTSRFKLLQTGAVLIAAALIPCYLLAPGKTISTIKSIQQARVYDPKLIDILARSKTYFYTIKVTDPKMKFINQIDSWQIGTFNNFIDFKRNGFVSNTPQIESISDINAPLLREPNAIILIPDRFRSMELSKTYNLYLLKTSCGVDCYSFSPRHMDLFLNPVKLSVDLPVGNNGWFRYGWSKYDPSVKSRWTDGEKAALFLPVGDVTAPLELTITGRPWVPQKERIIDVFAYDTKIATWRFTNNYEQIEKKALIPPDLIRNGTVEIILDIHNAVSPYEVGESNEKRKLGLRCRSIRLDPITRP